jgi:hypothetical protein
VFFFRLSWSYQNVVLATYAVEGVDELRWEFVTAT